MNRRTGGSAAVVCSMIAVGLTSFGVVGASSAAQPPPTSASAGEGSDATGGASTRPNRIIVVWKRSANATDRAVARDDADTTGVRQLGNARYQLLRPQAGQSVSDALAALHEDESVASAEQDGFQELHATSPTPNDPKLNQLWGLKNTGAKIDGATSAKAGADADVVPAWQRTRGTPSTVVADIDTGYDRVGPELKDVMWTNPGETAGDTLDNDSNGFADDVNGWDFVGANADSPVQDSNPTDDNDFDGGHGLHTAGTIGAKGNNGKGITGVAQDVRIMPLRVCTYSPNLLRTTCPLSAVVAAMNYAGANHARVANMSLGGTSPSSAQLQALADNPGTLYVISAGNDNVDTETARTYPCSYDPATEAAPVPNANAIDNVVCVAASDQNDDRASFSNYGATRVDLAAPGTEILSRYPVTANVWGDGFSTNNFTTNWSASPTNGWGRALPGDGGLLATAGMNDSPGAVPEANTLRRVTSKFATKKVPANAGACQLKGTRFVRQGSGGDFTYTVLADGVPIPNLNGVAPVDTAGSAMLPFQTVQFLAKGKQVSVRFDYTAGGVPDAADGVWLDSVRVECRASIADPDDLSFLDGTSMAAPHVSGAAALMFSLKPSASVSEVRNALLASVDKLPSWDGVVTTGGRLDTAAALGLLVPPNTKFVKKPGATSPNKVSFTFGRADSPARATFQCRLDAGAFAACASTKSFAGLALGSHTVEARAKDLYGNIDATPSSYTWQVVACTVPALKNKSLAQVKAALPLAGCTLGKVTKPRGVANSNLKVKSTTPAAGAARASGFAVKVTMIRK